MLIESYDRLSQVAAFTPFKHQDRIENCEVNNERFNCF